MRVSKEEIFRTVLCQSGRVPLYNTNYEGNAPQFDGIMFSSLLIHV